VEIRENKREEEVPSASELRIKMGRKLINLSSYAKYHQHQKQATFSVFVPHEFSDSRAAPWANTCSYCAPPTPAIVDLVKEIQVL
jgi:hypothetical protein